jgi:hypothetical protein
MTEPIGKAYKPWLLLSLAILIGSLMLLALAMTFAFLGANRHETPLWVIVLAVVGALGVALGFAGFFLIMLVAGWDTWRESRRVQIIPPTH